MPGMKKDFPFGTAPVVSLWNLHHLGAVDGSIFLVLVGSDGYPILSSPKIRPSPKEKEPTSCHQLIRNKEEKGIAAGSRSKANERKV